MNIPSIATANQTVPVTQSLFAADRLLELVDTLYELDNPRQCLLWQAGNTDTYVVRTQQNNYVLRIYRTGWRSDSEIAYELAALHHLAAKGIGVALPVACRSGAWFQTVVAPEGPRQLLLFHYAPGREAYDEPDFAARFGRSMAELHLAADDFQSSYARFRLDFNFLLDQPLRWMQSLLVHRPTDWQWFLDLAARLQQQVTRFANAGLDWGFCHGDALGSNVHWDGNLLTHFDFDDCGFGWRAYDLATYLWINAWHLPDAFSERWQAYLNAYSELRPVRAVDLNAIPAFVAVREFWVIGQQVRAASFRGHWWVNDSYFDQRLEFLRLWEERHLHQ